MAQEEQYLQNYLIKKGHNPRMVQKALNTISGPKTRGANRFTPGPGDDPETFGWRESQADTDIRGLGIQRGIDKRYEQNIARSEKKYQGTLATIAAAEAVRRGPAKDTSLAVASIKAIGELAKNALDPEERAGYMTEIKALQGKSVGDIYGRKKAPTLGRAEFKIKGRKQVRFISPGGEVYNPSELADEIMTLDSKKRKQWLALAQTTMAPDQYAALTKRLASFKRRRGKPHGKAIRAIKGAVKEEKRKPSGRRLTSSTYGVGLGKGFEERRKKAFSGAGEKLRETYKPIYDIIKRRPIKR